MLSFRRKSEHDCTSNISRVVCREEKETLTNQVSTLQTQMAALQSRLDSVSEASETATEREREADDRLDAALSLHARQLSQRQAREAELERTVAELGAALAVARQREQARGETQNIGTSSDHTGGSQTSTLRARLETAEEELETLKTQLMLEHQRVRHLVVSFYWLVGWFASAAWLCMHLIFLTSRLCSAFPRQPL